MAQLAEYQAEYATELDAVKLQHEQALTVHDHQALSRCQDQQSRHETLLAEREAEHERQLERFHAMHAEAMADGQLLHAEQLCELKDGHDRTLADMVSHACLLQRVHTVYCMMESRCLLHSQCSAVSAVWTGLVPASAVAYHLHSPTIFLNRCSGVSLCSLTHTSRLR